MRTLNMEPKLESLPQLYALCDELGVDARAMLALEEAFVNVANHSGATVAQLQCERRGEEWVFVLTDDGIPFDPTAAETEGEMSADTLKKGGQGIRIMRSMTDSMHYARENGKNILTLTKSDKTKG